jgi:hypothetical protein
MNDFLCPPSVQLRATAATKRLMERDAHKYQDDEEEDAAVVAYAHLANNGAYRYRGRGPFRAHDLAKAELQEELAVMPAKKRPSPAKATKGEISETDGDSSAKCPPAKKAKAVVDDETAGESEEPEDN